MKSKEEYLAEQIKLSKTLTRDDLDNSINAMSAYKDLFIKTFKESTIDSTVNWLIYNNITDIINSFETQILIMKFYNNIELFTNEKELKDIATKVATNNISLEDLEEIIENKKELPSGSC